MSKAVPVLLVYCVMTPLGIVIGILVRRELQGAEAQLVVGLLQSLAAGSFVYLSVHELSDAQFKQSVPSWQQCLLLLAGVGSMGVLCLWV